MGTIDLRREQRLAEIKEDLPPINTAMLQLMIRLRDDVELTHRFNGALGARTVKAAHMDGLEVEYALENQSLSSMRKTVALRFTGYDLDEIPDAEKAPYMMAAFEVFATDGGRPPGVFVRAPEGICDVIGIFQDVVPIVPIELNPNLVSKVGGIDFGR